MLDLNTGHDGSFSIGHANSSFDMLSRLKTMVLMAENLPLLVIRQQIMSAIDILVHLVKLKNKKRVVYEIVEIVGLKDGNYEINKLYEYKERSLKKCNELKDTRKLDKNKVTWLNIKGTLLYSVPFVAIINPVTIILYS